MKKLFVFPFLVFAFLFSFKNAVAQQLFFEVHSGYALTAYDLPKYNHAQGFVPLGFRLAGGLEHVQIGVEYNRGITNATFGFTDTLSNVNTSEEFVKSYYGALIRVNASSLPAYRFGVVFKFGAGQYNLTRNVYDDKSESPIVDPIKYEPTWGFKAGVGISSPIYTTLHWEIGYQFNYVKWDPLDLSGGVEIPGYSGFYHSFEAGLSLNLVFGNTAKKCRRVISSSGGGRRY